MILETIEDVKTLIQRSTDPNLIYRGQADESWVLKPRIFDEPMHAYQMVLLELIIFRPNFCFAYLNKIQNGINSQIEWLSLLQHYGCRTRILDWTHDIKVALYFACSDLKQFQKDAALFITNKVDYPKCNSVRLMDVEELGIIETRNDSNPRIEAQKGLFMIWPYTRYRYDNPEYIPDLNKHIEINKLIAQVEKITIPSGIKPQILRYLNSDFNISSETLLMPKEVSSKFTKKVLNEVYNRAIIILRYWTNPKSLMWSERPRALMLSPNIGEGSFKGNKRLAKIIMADNNWI